MTDGPAGELPDVGIAEADATPRWPRRRVTRRRVLIGLGSGVAVTIGGGVWFGVTRYAAGPPHRGLLAITGATALAGAALTPLDGATILVRDGVITAVGRATDVAIPEHADRLDVPGATVLPGLIDLHVHLGSAELDRGEHLGPARLPGFLLELVRHQPAIRRALLEHGVTAVRSLGDERGWVTELRRLTREGELEGPRVYCAGPLFTTARGHPVVTFGLDPDGDAVRLPTTAEEARRMVRELATGADPVDVVKVVQERGGADRPLDPLPRDVLDAIVEEAHAHGRPVTAHWGTRADLEDALAADVDGLEHVESRDMLGGWPEGALEAMVEAGTALTPTLAVTEVAVSPTEHEQLRARVAELHAAGGRVVAGSDAGVPGVRFGEGLLRELELLTQAGLRPPEALRAATSAASQVLEATDIGVLEAGRAADLLVVDGRPHEDLTALRRTRLVLREGRVVVDR